MSMIGKIKKLFNRKVNSYTLSKELDGDKKPKAEIILTEKESREMDRKKRQERFEKWLNEHKSSI